MFAFLYTFCLFSLTNLIEACCFNLVIAFLIQMGNKGAFIRFTAPEMKPQIITFSAVVSSTLFFCICMYSLGLKMASASYLCAKFI
jgi:hypothetical protein